MVLPNPNVINPTMQEPTTPPPDRAGSGPSSRLMPGANDPAPAALYRIETPGGEVFAYGSWRLAEAALGADPDARALNPPPLLRSWVDKPVRFTCDFTDAAGRVIPAGTCGVVESAYAGTFAVLLDGEPRGRLVDGVLPHELEIVEPASGTCPHCGRQMPDAEVPRG